MNNIDFNKFNNLNLPFPQIPALTVTVKSLKSDNSPSVSSEEIENLSWLQNHQSTFSTQSTTLKMFAHEVYDFGANQSIFEGESFSDTIKRFSEVIHALPAQEVSKTIKDAMPLFTECENTFKKFNEVKNQNLTHLLKIDRINFFFQQLSSAISLLPIGGKKLIQGGWAGNPTGHAILYCIERTSTNDYKFTLFNTGSGLDYHPTIITSKGQIRYQTFLTIEKITVDKFSPEFFQNLLEPQLIPYDYNNVYKAPIHIYHHILNHLDGIPEKVTDPKMYPTLFSKAQRAGTCSMKSIFAAMRYFSIKENLDSPKKIQKTVDDFSLFRFVYRRHALIEKCLHFFNENYKWTESTDKVISDAIRHLSRASLSLYKRGLLKEGELKACEVTVLDIRSKLALKKRTYEESLNPNIYRISEDLSLTAPIAFFPYFHDSILLKTDQDQFEIKDFIDLSEPPKSITSTNIGSYLLKWAEFKIPATFTKDGKAFLHAKMLEALRLLPIPTSSMDIFWNEVPTNEIESCLKGLFRLSKSFLVRFEEDSNLINYSPSVFIEMQTALAIGEVLCRRNPHNQLESFKLPVHQLISFIQSSTTLLHDPQDQKRLNDLIQYFVPDEDFRTDSASKTSKPEEFLFALTEKNEMFTTTLNICKENIKADKQLQYFAKFINGAEAIKAFSENNCYDFDSELVHIITHARLENPLIPKEMLYLRNLIFTAQLANPCLKNSLSALEIQDSEFFYTPINTTYILSYGKIEKKPCSKVYQCDFNYKIITDLKEKVIGKLQGTDQNTFMSTDGNEKKRDIEILQTNAHDEIVRYLAFLETRPDGKLESENSQQILASHFLRPQRLLHTIMNEPLMAQKIMSLLNRKLDYFISADKWQTAMVLIDISNRCADYIRYAHQLEPNNFPLIHLRNYRELLIKQILSRRLDGDVKTMAFETLQGFAISQTSYEKDPLSYKEYAIDWISAKLLQGLNLNKEHLPHVTQSFIDTKCMFDARTEFNIQKILERPYEDDRNFILNGVASRFLERQISQKWKGTYPIFQSENILIDLEEGFLQEGDKFCGVLPLLIRKSHYYSRLLTEIKSVNRSVIKSNNNPKICSYRYEIEDKFGTTLFHMTETKKNETSTQEITEKTVTITKLFDDKEYVLCYSPQQIMQPKIDLINKDTLYWYNKENCTYIAENEDREFYYLKSKNKGFENIIQSLSDSKDFSRLLINASKTSAFKALSHFINDNYRISENYRIACWAKNTAPGLLDQIDLLGLDLHFFVGKDANNKDQLFSREVTGFYIANDQLKKYQNIWPRYLILENDKHERKIIMRKLERECSNPTDFDRNLNEQNYTYKDKIIFDLKFQAGKVKLLSNSAQDGLYLLKFLLAKKHYTQASQILSQCNSLSCYSQQEIDQIIELIKYKPGGGHPSALIIYLRLSILLENNHLKYAPKSKLHPLHDINSKNKVNLELLIEYGNNVENIYTNYINNLENATDPLLNEEEKTLLRMLNKISLKDQKNRLFSSPVLAKRLEFLLNPTSNRYEIIESNSISQTLKPMKINVYTLWYSLKYWMSKPVFESEILTTEKLFPVSTTMIDDYFMKNHQQIYNMAREGSQAQRNSLRQILKFLLKALPDNSMNRESILFLIAVCEKPDSLPQLEILIDLLKNHSPTEEFITFFAKIEKAAIFQELEKSAKKFGIIGSQCFDINDSKKRIKNNIDLLVNEHPKILSNTPLISTLPLPPNLDLLDAQWEKQFIEFKMKFNELKDTEFPSFKAHLQNIESEAKSMLSIDEKELVNLLNGISSDATIEDVLKHESLNEKPKLNFDDLILLFEKGNLEDYKKRTFLSDEQIRIIEDKIARHLIEASRMGQLTRVLNLLKERNSTIEKNIIDKKIVSEFESPRFYSFTKGNELLKRTYLVFEFRNTILLRKKQVDNLDDITKFSDSLNLLLELGTGSGKSKVLAPLMQRLREAFGNIIFNVWPNTLYEVNKRDMKNLVGNVFKQQADTFEFSRETSVSHDKLLFILREIVAVLLEGRQLNATPESLQCCELKYLELLHKMAHEGEGVPTRAIELLQEILKFIHSSEAHIDESHLNLSPRREVNFTVGNPRSEPLERIEMIETIFDFLITDPKANKLLGIRQDRQRFVLPDEFKSKIAPELSRLFIPKLGIKKEYEPLFLDYVQGIKTDINWLDTHPNKMLIILLREQLTFLLPELLQKSVNVNYGLSHLKNGVEYAKPYSGNDSPIESAEYDNIYETLDKTYLTYLYQGLSEKQLWKLIQFLQFESLQAAKSKAIDPRNTKAYIFFKENFPEKLTDLFTIREKDLELFHGELKHNKTLNYYYIKNIISPTIKKFPFKLKSSSQNFAGMFKSSLAMTATPGDKEIYNENIKLKRDEGNEQLVIKKIEKKCSDPKTIHFLKSSKPAEILSSMKNLFTPDSGFRMLIDIGALLKGISNYTVAEELLIHFAQNAPHIKGIVYFDKNDRLMVLEENRKEPIPIEQCGLDLNERFTYCDQRHSIGADILQYHSAKGLATFDKLTDKDAVVQGVGRLRQFMQDQKVEWVLTSEVKNLVQQNNTVTIHNLLSFANKNQVLREKEDLRRALKQQMDHEIRSVLMKKLLACSSIKDQIELFKDFEPLLVEEVSDLNGDQCEEEPTITSLQRYQQKLIEKLNALTKLTKKEISTIKNRLDSYESRFILLKHKLPKTVINRSYDLETETEIQQNIEVNTETNIQQITINNNDLNLRDPTRWQKDFSFYRDDWLQPTPLNGTISSLVEKIIDKTKNIFKWLSEGKKTEIPLRILACFSFFGITSAATIGTILLITQLSLKAFSLLSVIPNAYILPVVISIATIALIGITAYLIYKYIKSKEINKIEYQGKWVPRSNKRIPIFKANDILKFQKNKIISNAHSFFAPTAIGQILMTNNFITRKVQKSSDSVVSPLSKEQKNAHEVLVIHDELENGKDKWTVVVGDQSTDAMFWREELERNREEFRINPAGSVKEKIVKQKRKVCLYDLTLGVVQNGIESFNEEKEMNENIAFQELITKVKLYNGDVHYNEIQQKVLENIAKDKKDFNTLKSFYQQAKLWHNVKQQSYPKSWIAKFFEDKSNSKIVAV